MNRILIFSSLLTLKEMRIRGDDFIPVQFNETTNHFDTIPTPYKKYDSLIMLVPTFVVDTAARRVFFEDLDEIEKNKTYIHPKVWDKFQKTFVYLQVYPLPASVDSFEHSLWVNPIWLANGNN